jgi:GST-like protein
MAAAEFLAVHEYKNVHRWADQIAARPAVKRGRMVNRLQGDPANQLHERHDASDFRNEDAGQGGGPRLVPGDPSRHRGCVDPRDQARG